MGNAPSLPGLGGGRAHGMRYDDPGGSSKGHRPEGIPAVAMEIQTAEQIEEESIGGDSEVEVLEPLENHTMPMQGTFQQPVGSPIQKGLYHGCVLFQNLTNLDRSRLQNGLKVNWNRQAYKLKVNSRCSQYQMMSGKDFMKSHVLCWRRKVYA